MEELDRQIGEWLQDSDTESEDDYVCDVAELSDEDETFDDNIPNEDNIPLLPIQPAARRRDRPQLLVWNDHIDTSPNSRPKAFPFTGTPGMNVAVNDNKDPYELFRLFFTDELIDKIVLETNKYAAQFLANKPLQRFSRFQAWKPTNRDEILVLLAVYTLHGLIWKPEIDFYYTHKPLFSTPGFSSLMSRNRLQLLSRFLHFSDNEVPVLGNKKLQKIKAVLDYLASQFEKVYTPESNLAVDESLLLWKGRLGFRQYIPIKRARFGIKSYILSESTSGYIWKLKVYCGSGTDIQQNNNFGHATNVVLTLLRGLENKGYCVYVDNYYCSPELALELNKMNTDVVGTLRKNRVNVPKDLVANKLQKGELSAKYEENGKMMCMKWVDKRPVLCLSTIHELETTEVIRKGKRALVPTLIDDYNRFMGGVDRVDQMLSAYPIERKRQKRWYKKEFRHLINMSIFNAHALHTKNGGKMSSYEFRQVLVECIVRNHLGENINPKRGRPSLEEDPLRLKERHFPEYVPSSEKKANASRRCVVCSSKKIRKESRYQCGPCDVGLCAAPCFKDFHTKRKY